jgi:acyl carrier protein
MIANSGGERPMTTFESMQAILQSKFNLAPDVLRPDTTLKDLEVDSLSMVEILFDVEDEFTVVIPSEPAEWQSQMRTFGDLVNYVDKLIATQRPAAASSEMPV